MLLTTPEKIAFFVVLVLSTGYFAKRTVLLARLVRLGRQDSESRTDHLPARFGGMLADVFLQRRVLRRPVAGLLHLLIVWGFFVFAINTINHFTGAFFPEFHLFGRTVLAEYYSVLADIFAVLILTGVVGLAIRRYVFHAPGLTPRSIESAVVFFFIGGAMAAYLLDNAAGIALTPGEVGSGHVVSALLSGLFTGMSGPVLAAIAHVAWWCDALMHLMLIALLVIPTKHLHLVAGPLNLLFKRGRPVGQMVKLDLEDENALSFGVSKVDEFSWKQNLDLYACIECGRCSVQCPTANSDKALNPKELIVGLKAHLINSGPRLLAGTPDGNDGGPALIGDAVSKDAVWACTTCGNCVEQCPMGIEHIDKITDMRSALVLMQSDFPPEAAGAFRNMETAGNPWGFPPNDRAAWAAGLDVPLMADKKKADILWWVGCSGSYDERCKQVSVAMARILHAAGVDFAILGREERCTCESARRLGNEYLYQTATAEIADIFQRYEFKRVLVTCPHCYNTFKNDYPLFGIDVDVIHHTEFLDELITEKRLRVSNSAADGVTVFHDSCYLGRHNGVYDAPRRVLASAGCELTSVQREKREGFCCGAGGGHMWLEEKGEPVSAIRAEELIASGASQIAAACPFCITMLRDGVKKRGSGVEVRDIAEIIAHRLS